MLWAACRHGFPWVAQIMARVCDVTEEDLEYGSTPLHVLYNLPADYMGSVAEELVHQGAPVDAHCNSNAEPLFGFIQNGIALVGTPLNWAVKAGNVQAVQCLLDLGADPLHNCQNCDQSPLETAISLFRADIVKVFLDTTGPIPPVPVAGSDQRLPEVTYAVLRGFSPRISHEHERSVLHGSALAERSIETLDVVLTYVKYGEPQFLDAILYGTVSPDIFRQPTLLFPYLSTILIERGASQLPRLGPQGGGAPLLYRIVHLWEIHEVNCEAFLESILQLYPDRIDISLPNKDGRTALHEAAIFNAYPMISLLVKYGADINAEDTDGCTPLALASRMNSKVSFELLLDLGAEITHSRGSVLHDGALPQFPRSIIPFALLESKHRERLLVPEILEGIHETLRTTPLGTAILASEIDAVRAFLHCEANSRAPSAIGSWPFTLSIREVATMKRYRPSLLPIIAPQRRRGMLPDEHIRNIRSVQQILYSGCKESDYEEPDSITMDNGLIMRVHVRKTRPEEWYPTSYVSLDSLL